ncbi:unnamed protein product, partial [Sphagnum balticum]
MIRVVTKLWKECFISTSSSLEAKIGWVAALPLARLTALLIDACSAARFVADRRRQHTRYRCARTTTQTCRLHNTIWLPGFPKSSPVARKPSRAQ